MHYYQFHIAEYQSHTKHLTPMQDVCYRRLLDWQYLHEKPIPSDAKHIARLVMLNECLTDVEQVLSEFFTETNDGWINARAFTEIALYAEKINKASLAGRASAAKRRLEIKQTLNGRPADVQPTINQEPITINNNKSIVDNDVTDCPQQDIVNLYKQILPNGIQPLTWTGSRANLLKARWRESKKRQSIDWWQGLFEYITKSPFLMGQASSADRKPFTISLDWIVKSENFMKITEGKYHA